MQELEIVRSSLFIILVKGYQIAQLWNYEHKCADTLLLFRQKWCILCSRHHPNRTLYPMMKKVFLLFAFLLAFPFFVHSAEEAFFEDPLRGELKDGWTWLREVPDNWRITDEGLDIRMEPLPEGGWRNILRRDVPKVADGPFDITVEVRGLQPYTNQWQQAGLFWMQGDNYRVKFILEIIDGILCVFPNSGGGPAATALETEHVVLRFRIDGRQLIAEYQPNATGEFLRAFERELPPRNDELDGISLQCWHGPAGSESWSRFTNFSITKPGQLPSWERRPERLPSRERTIVP